MSTFIKIVGSIIALVLIFSGGLDFGLTTIPGIAMLSVIWGFEWKNL